MLYNSNIIVVTIAFPLQRLAHFDNSFPSMIDENNLPYIKPEEVDLKLHNLPQDTKVSTVNLGPGPDPSINWAANMCQIILAKKYKTGKNDQEKDLKIDGPLYTTTG